VLASRAFGLVARDATTENALVAAAFTIAGMPAGEPIWSGVRNQTDAA
jgi:hypothetical protein